MSGFFLLLSTFPQLSLFLRGVKIKTKFNFKQKQKADILDNLDELEEEKPRSSRDNIESKSFHPIKLWSLLFGLLFIVFGSMLVISYHDTYGIHMPSLMILSKAIRNCCMVTGGTLSVVYVVAIRFFQA